MNEPDKIAWITLGATVIGWPLSGYIGYLFGLRTQRIAMEVAAKNAACGRIREFVGFVGQFKAVISNPNPEKWVTYFCENAPILIAKFVQIASDFSDADRYSVRLILEDVVAFSKINPAEIYENEDKIREMLVNIERIIYAA